MVYFSLSACRPFTIHSDLGNGSLFLFFHLLVALLKLPLNAEQRQFFSLTYASTKPIRRYRSK